MPKKVVILGAGHGAGQLCDSLLKAMPDVDITLIGDEGHLPYQRPPLSKKYLARELPIERLLVRPASFYKDRGVSYHLCDRAVSINRKAKSVKTQSGQCFEYDFLVIATGARPRRLPVPDEVSSALHYVRSIADVDRLQDALSSNASRVLIIGAGYIGLETAAVLTSVQCHVTIVEANERVLSRVTSQPVSEYFERLHRSKGVNIITKAMISGFDKRSCGAYQVQLRDGQELSTDLIVAGIGAVPNDDLAGQCGLRIDDGVLVDSFCRTSDPHIFAIGDCARHPHPSTGEMLRLESVQNALDQAKTAAASICGAPAPYEAVPWFWSDQYETKLQTAGLVQDSDEFVISGDPLAGSFAVYYFQDKRLCAVDAVNKPAEFVSGKQLLQAGVLITKQDLKTSSLAQVYKDCKSQKELA